MFADELITPTVLTKLGIQNTCTLRGDQYHLLNEVWPAAFGSYCSKMRCHLEAMFSSKSREEYEVGYVGAREVIVEDPAMCSKLDVFYHQPERYAGYFLRGLDENLGLKGDVAAEQNHSSVCAHLGEGATWQIAEQVSKLLRRQQEQGKQRNEKQALQNARTHRYISRFKNQTGVDDVLAKKCLSMNAYTRFISATLKPSTSLQHRIADDGSVFVWPAGRLESDNHEKVKIIPNERCSCNFRVKWNALCMHEYKVDGIMNLDKFSTRWLNRTGFESRVLPTLLPTIFQNGETDRPNPPTDMLPGQSVRKVTDGWHDMGFNINTSLDEDVDDLGGSCDEDGDGDCGIDDMVEDNEDRKLGRLSYQSVKANCEEMCRYVQNDQLQLAELKLLTDRVLIRLRNKQNIHACFTDIVVNHSVNKSSVDQSHLPKSAVGRIISNPQFMKRKRSRFEHGRINRATKAQPSIAATTSTSFQASDENHLPPPKLDHRACSFCKKAHHFVGKCPTLLQHGVPPIAARDTKARTKLQAELTAIGGIVTYTREVDDQRTLYTTLPRRIGAIFIFKRLYVKNITEKEHHDNYCVECTIYKTGGEEHELYSRSLFLVSCIAGFVIRSTTNHIISMLQYTNQAPPTSQTTETTMAPSRPPNSFINPMINNNNLQPDTIGGSQFSHESNFLYSQLSQQLSQQMLPSAVPRRPPYPYPYDYSNSSLPF